MKTLGSFVTFRKGKPPKASSHGTLPILTPEYLRTGEMGDLAETTGREVILQGGEIVLLWDGSNAGEFFRANSGVLSSTMVVLFFSPHEIKPDYLFYDLKRFEPILKGKTAGSGIPHVDKEILLSHEILEREPGEQDVVANVLRSFDQMIDATEVTIAKHRQIKAGLVHDLLSRGVDGNGRLRDPATDAFKPSSLGGIPAEWSVSTLSECTSRITVGLATSVTKYYRNKGVPIIRNLNIRNGFLDDSELLYLDPAFAARFATKSVQYRDVITCRTGANVGDTCLVPQRLANSQTFTTLITTTKKEKLVPDFLVDYLASEQGQRELRNVLVGAGKDNLNAGQRREVRVPLPDPKEQGYIHSIIQSANDSINQQELWRDKLLALRTGLMQDLLTGRVSVAPLLSAAKEPASL
jgi:type I restriction enzyme S subunit